MSTLETLQDLLIRDHALHRQQVAPDVLLVDLGVDSLALVELMFQVEDRFGIEVPLTPPEELRTLADLARYVDGLIAGAGPGGRPRPARPTPDAARPATPGGS